MNVGAHDQPLSTPEPMGAEGSGISHISSEPRASGPQLRGAAGGSASRPPQYELLTAWVLLLLAIGPGHGYELRRRLEAAGVCTDTNAIYRVLRKLERDGCTESTWAASHEGPHRRLYRLTENGRNALSEHIPAIAATRDDHAAFLRAHAKLQPRR